jgi:hypothetical protein
MVIATKTDQLADVKSQQNANCYTFASPEDWVVGRCSELNKSPSFCFHYYYYFVQKHRSSMPDGISRPLDGFYGE